MVEARGAKGAGQFWRTAHNDQPQTTGAANFARRLPRPSCPRHYLRAGATQRGEVGSRSARLASLSPLSYALRASARRDAFSVLPPHLETAKRTHRLLTGFLL